MAKGRYTFFGRVVDGFMGDRGFDQEDVAREFRVRDFEGVQQQEVSNWLRTPNVPHYAGALLPEILRLDEEQERLYNWAFVNGRVHLTDDEVQDLERRFEAYRELRRQRRKGVRGT